MLKVSILIRAIQWFPLNDYTHGGFSNRIFSGKGIGGQRHFFAASSSWRQIHPLGDAGTELGKPRAHIEDVPEDGCEIHGLGEIHLRAEIGFHAEAYEDGEPHGGLRHCPGLDIGPVAEPSGGMDAEELYASGGTGGSLDARHRHHEHCPFRKYYQIGGGDELDVAKPEPRKKVERELKGYTDPAHSPFGLIGQIARDTGWSMRYIMRGVNYPTLMLMWQDYPRHVDVRKKTTLEYLRELEAEDNKAASSGDKKGIDPLSYFQQLEEED